jgi:hypothetical protein
MRNSWLQASAAEALTGHPATMRANGDAIPSPCSFEELKHDHSFVTDSLPTLPMRS